MEYSIKITGDAEQWTADLWRDGVPLWNGVISRSPRDAVDQLLSSFDEAIEEWRSSFEVLE